MSNSTRNALMLVVTASLVVAATAVAVPEQILVVMEADVIGTSMETASLEAGKRPLPSVQQSEPLGSEGTDGSDYIVPVPSWQKAPAS